MSAPAGDRSVPLTTTTAPEGTAVPTAPSRSLAHGGRMRAWRPIVYPADMAYGKRVSRTTAIEARRDRVMSLALAGATTRQIARQLSVGRGTIARDIKARLDAKAATCPDTAAYRELSHQRINTLLMAVWNRAIGTPAQGGSPATPSDLDAVDRALRLIHREGRLLGLDLPTKVAVTGEVEVKGGLDLSGLSDKQLAALQAWLDTLDA